ncbi:MAG: hypothetical protein RBU30_16135 [Polyangia bacterium]|nr:hypothetical protein [Polyangia bacterium]
MVCKHIPNDETSSCGTSGDTDGDGFCDNVDFCPDTFSGLNCDLDGDGRGEGYFEAGGCQALKHTPIRDLLGAKDPVVKEKLARVMCGACDGCNGVDDRVHPADQDGDGLLDFQGYKIDMSTPVVCDHDVDGDGVANELDCDPRNPTVRFDLDQDGRCDDGYADVPGTSEDPYGQCQQECRMHLPAGSISLNLCYRRCRKDSCTWITHAERLCPFGQATRQPECANELFPSTPCPDAWRTRLGSLDPACASDNSGCPEGWKTRLEFCTTPIADPFCGPYAACMLHGEECESVDLGLCNAIHGNPASTYNGEQLDYDGDAIGDKCDWVNSGTPGFSQDPGGIVLVEPAESDGGMSVGHMAYYQRGERYRIRFNAWGGSPSLDTSQTPPVPDYGSAPRMNTQIGACYCDKNLYGEWMEECYLTRCPYRQDARPNENLTAWNPISSSFCRALEFSGDPSNEATYNQYQLCYNRTLAFTRDESSNFQELYWDWKHMRELSDLGQIVGATYAKSAAAPWERTTRIRVAWPMYGEPIMLTDDTPPYNNEAAFSRNLGLSVIDLAETRPVPQVPSGRIPTHFPVTVESWKGPRPPVVSGYALVTDAATSSAALLALGADSPVVTSVRPLLMDGPVDLTASFAGAGGLVSAELIGGSQGTVNGVFLYQGPSSPARLLFGEDDPGRDDIQLSSSDALWASPAPEAYDALLVFVADVQELLLLGSPMPGGARDCVWRLRLETGDWEGPIMPPELRDRRGFTADYDPITRKVLIFGGTKADGSGPTTGGNSIEPSASAGLLLLDAEHLIVTAPVRATESPFGLARERHGSRLLPDRRALYVAGGERDGQPLVDIWRLDLLSFRWERQADQSPTSIGPYIHIDQPSNTLWIGDFTNAEPLAGLPLHVGSSTGLWYETRALRLDRAGGYPIFDVLVGGRSSAYGWSADLATPLPGSYLIARLDSDDGSLAVSLRELGDEEVSMGLLDVTGEQAATLFCPSRGTCLAQVVPAPQDTVTGPVPFRIDLQEAVPELDLRSSPLGWMDDLLIFQGSLVIAGSWGLRVLDPTTLGQRGHLGGWRVSGASGLEPCGPDLCVSRTGLEGLVIVSLSDPSSPKVLGGAFTLGLGWDVAVWGTRAYVAHGTLGVGVYDISAPRSPRCLGSLAAGGVVVSVATRGSLLAVGKVGGDVELYELQGGPIRLSTLSAKGPLEKLRFRGPRLWALRNPGKMAEIFDLSRPEAPARLGEIAEEPREEFTARYLGPWRFTLDGNRVSRYRFVSLVP